MRNLLLSAVALAAAAALFTPRPAQAWHKEGHMAVALIAYRQLEVNDQKKVQDVLKQHPHYDIFLAADVPADANLDEWVVMQAAVWPDWVKSPRPTPHHPLTKAERAAITRDFANNDWHYANKAIVIADGTTPAELMQIQANVEKERGEIATQFPRLVQGFKGQGDINLAKEVWANRNTPSPLTGEQAKAIALCWILHLVGDSHQPLHSASMYSKDAPKGDAGGNGFAIRWGNHSQRLHTIWDGAFGWDDLKGRQSSQFGVVDGLTRDLLKRIKPTAAELAVSNLDDWLAESFKLADEKAYRPHGVLLPGVHVGFGESLPDAADLDPLPRGYEDLVKMVAEKRVTLAGYRMGKMLKGLVQ